MKGSATFQSPIESFYAWEQRAPDRVWLKMSRDGGWDEYSWRQVGDQARRVANALMSSDLVKGDKVGICALNSPQWFIVDLACMMTGMVLVPIYTTMTVAKMAYVAEHSDMKMLFTDGSLDITSIRTALPEAALVVAMNDRIAGQSDTSMMAIQVENEPLPGFPAAHKDDLWTIVYTSGTTGMPKGVMHSQQTLGHPAATLPALSTESEEGRFLSFLPLAHAGERVLVELHSLYSGGTVHFNESRETFASDLKAVRPTFFFAVPRIWVNLKAAILNKIGGEAWAELEHDKQRALDAGKVFLEAMGLDKVTFSFSGAAPIASKDLLTWQSLGLPIFEGYGQSECMSGTSNAVGNVCVGSVGKCFDEQGEVMIDPNNGEILLRAPSIMLGYYKAEDKTAETIVDGWVRTGDKGKFDQQGFLHITGRVKEIFKTAKGKYVAPAPIENKYASCPLVEQMCLVGPGLAQTIMLLTLTEASQSFSQAEIRDQLDHQRKKVNDQLEAHELISHVVVCKEPWTIENELLTHTLKILRDDVAARHASAVNGCELQAEGVVWE